MRTTLDDLDHNVLAAPDASDAKLLALVRKEKRTLITLASRGVRQYAKRFANIGTWESGPPGTRFVT